MAPLRADGRIQPKLSAHVYTLAQRRMQWGREAFMRQLLKVEKRVSVHFFFSLLCFCLQFHCFQAALDLMWKIRKDWLVM